MSAFREDLKGSRTVPGSGHTNGMAAAETWDRRSVALAFGRVLRQKRRARELSQEEFAELSGLDRTTPSLYERGLRQPTLSSLMLIAEALGEEAGELVRAALERLQQRP